MGIEIGAGLKFTISAGTLILFVVYAHLKPLHVFQPVFDWVAEGMANVNELLDWALKPVVLVLKIFFRAVAIIVRPIISLFRHEEKIISEKDQVAFDIDCGEEKKEVHET